MGIFPRVVALDTTFTWDHVTARLPRGQVIDVAPGSPLESAIGADRLVPLNGARPQPPTEPAPAIPLPAADVPEAETAQEPDTEPGGSADGG